MELLEQILSRDNQENLSDTERLLLKLDAQTKELRAQSQSLKTFMENLPGGMICCENSDELKLLRYSDSFPAMFGYTAAELRELYQDEFRGMIYPEDWEPCAQSVREQLARGNTKQIEYRVIRRDGSLRWVLDRGQLVVEPDGREVFNCILIDITEARQAQSELRLSLERHKIIMDQTTDIIFEWEINSGRVHYSPNWQKLFGYEPLADGFRDELPKGSHVHPDDAGVFQGLMNDVAQGTAYREAEIRIRKQDGHYLWCRVRATLQTDSQGQPAKAIGVIIDIDDEKRRTQLLLDQAARDALTGLYNKGATEDLIRRRLEERLPNHRLAYIIIDVDNFKQVNDIFGHLSGDVILADIAGMLQKQFRGDDIIGRIGGDEFAILMGDIADKKIVEKRARELLSSFQRLLSQNANPYPLSCSIGISIAPDDGESFRELYKNADLALYQAKIRGKNACAFYSSTLTEFNPGAPSPESPRSSLGANIDSDSAWPDNWGNLSKYVFRVLYQTADLEKAVARILEIVGRQFDVSRVYIFEDTPDGKYCDNTFEWCGPGVKPQRDQLQRVPYEELDDYYANFNDSDIFYCRDISALPAGPRKILESQDIKSMLQRAIRDDGQLKGYVGFDECRSNRIWTQEQIEILSLVAEIVSTFLFKQRAQKESEQARACLNTILDYQETWLYVIEKDTFEILYANQKTLNLFPMIGSGSLCHEVFYKASAPCAGCPVFQLNDGVKTAAAKLHSAVLDKTVSAKATVIPWTDGKEVYLMSCQELE